MMRKLWRLISAVCAMAALLCLMLGTTALAEPKAFDYLLPEADTRNYTEDEIANLPPQVITYAKNEIYARHGRKFVSPELTAWFDMRPWYYGTTEPEAFDPGVLNTCETANIAALEQREMELGEDAYTLDRAGWDTQVVDDYLSGQAFGGMTSGNSIGEAISGSGIGEAISGNSAAGMTSGNGIAAGMECINIFSTDYFSFRIPDAWMTAGFLCIPDTEDVLSFCCRSAWSAPGPEDGLVCTIDRVYQELEEGYFPSAAYLGEKDGNYFYLLYPTDVRFDPSDQTITDEYTAMLEAAREIPGTFELK